MFTMIAYSVRFLNAYKNIKAPQCLTTVRQKEIFKRYLKRAKLINYQLAFCSSLSLSAISAINSLFVGLPL